MVRYVRDSIFDHFCGGSDRWSARKKKTNGCVRIAREEVDKARERERERERESDAIKIVYVNAENNFFCRVFY